ncbi:MAG: Holliday junction branch migration protein RuvA [Candidatus Faecousia sp.]|nr:Holliday junction branch migration protein RuvA [Candidatus Faecousia sp.]
MFYYLEGKIALLDANLAVVDCGGVGYACFASNYTLSNLRVGETHRLFTHCNIKEDAFDIYGFSSRDELRLFELLIGVTGVGPTSALAILSVLNPDQLTLSILTGDEKAITRAKGVGAKSAKRIILELNDKIGGELDFSDGPAAAGPVLPQKNSKVALATAALSELGYSQAEAAAALKGADAESLSVEELIRFGLRAMVVQ